MYKIARIKFTPTEEITEKTHEKVDGILWMLHQNGQIIDGWIVEKRNSSYVATVVTTDDDSLDDKYFNRYIRKEITSFEIETDIVGDDAMATDCCRCQTHSYYILAIHPDQSSSPVFCGDCGREIPLTKIPYLFKEEEHYSILSFQKTYLAVDRLWMESLSDRFTKRQIVDCGSQLNERGLNIRAELENKLGKPVYYLLCNPVGGWFEFSRSNKTLDLCPKCGGKLEYKNNPYAEKVCHTCRLAFVTHEYINEKTNP